MMFTMLALNQIAPPVTKQADYSFTDNLGFVRSNSCSCVIESVERGETDTDNIDIGTDGTTVTATYVISAGDVTNLSGNQMRITLTAKQETGLGTTILTDNDLSGSEGTLTASLTIGDGDISGNTVWIGLVIEDVPFA